MPSSAAHSTGVQLGTCLWPLVHSFISKSQRSGTLALDTQSPQTTLTFGHHILIRAYCPLTWPNGDL